MPTNTDEITVEDAIKTIQELMKACRPDSKYYKVGDMAIKALLREPKRRIVISHTET